MSIIDQVRDGLQAFYATQSKWDGIEIRMHPALSERLLNEQKDIAWQNFKRDMTAYAPFSVPMPTMLPPNPLAFLYGQRVVLDDSLPANRVTFSLGEATHSVEVTTPSA